jgi:hypothetical protein
MEFPSLALGTAQLWPANAFALRPSAKHNEIECGQNRPQHAKKP